MTVLLYYCITVLLYYCITVLLYYCITVLLYYCITVLLYTYCQYYFNKWRRMMLKINTNYVIQKCAQSRPSNTRLASRKLYWV